MTVRKFGRRWMLMGGGAALAIPALPSLFKPGSRAAAQEVESPRRMVVIATEHGGIWNRWMYPPESAASTPMEHPLHTVHTGALPSRVEGGQRVISDVLRAPEDRFTESIASKMNLIRGLDVPFYYGHARHILGTYGRTSSDADQAPRDQETADQILARTSLYRGTPRRRIINFSDRGLSMELADPSRGLAGGLQPAEIVSPQAVFNSVYVEVEPDGPSEPERPPPIDAVYESYRRLQSGAFGAGARLGSADRRRLTRYMDRLNDIRAALSAGVGLQCADVPLRTDLPREPALGSPLSRSTFRLLNDIVLAGFMCDSSRIALLRMDDPWTDAMEADGGYHEVAHNAAGLGNAAQTTRLGGLLRDGMQRFFEQGFLDLVGRLDEIPDGEGSMLDNTLVWWAQEAGPQTHIGDSLPLVTAGGAGGLFETGRYLDYRNRQLRAISDEENRLSNEGRHPGACFFQWTTTYLDAFDVPRNQWQLDGRRSFTPFFGGSFNIWEYERLGLDLGAYERSCDAPLPGLLRG